MKRALRLTPGKIAALITLGLVLLILFVYGGNLFSPGELSAESHRKVKLGGVSSHADIGGNCSACHSPPWSSRTMADRCMDCHADIRSDITNHRSLHGNLPAGSNCRDCHTEHRGRHAKLTNLEKFDHQCTGFKLDGKHTSVQCASCHKNDVYKGTETTCVGCHASPKVPTVHKANYGDNCQQCHSTTTFKAPNRAGFDHSHTGFPLTGKHTSTQCSSCHKNDVFKGTSTSCVSCHAEPKVPEVHKFNYGANCQQCHNTTTFKNPNKAGFDHSRTAFPLTGKHTNVQCASCHKNDVYRGTPTTCVGCHTEPKVPQVHKFNYGNNCAGCHTTNTWTGATFKHTGFPINHGKRSGNTCATCHDNPQDFKVYTCYGCHEHRPAKIQQIHAKRKIENLNACVKCHRGRGGERERERERGDAGSFDPGTLLAGGSCPIGQPGEGKNFDGLGFLTSMSGGCPADRTDDLLGWKHGSITDDREWKQWLFATPRSRSQTSCPPTCNSEGCPQCPLPSELGPPDQGCCETRCGAPHLDHRIGTIMPLITRGFDEDVPQGIAVAEFESISKRMEMVLSDLAACRTHRRRFRLRRHSGQRSP